MTYLTVGINHKTAQIALREKIIFSSDALPKALEQALDFLDTTEIAILSTCNRTELYGINPLDPKRTINWFSHYHKMSDSLLQQHTYFHTGQAAVRHMMRVASGLDSMILGESQILGQLKSAYTIAQKTGTTGSLLNQLFQKSFSTAKKIRTETAIGKQPVSVAYAATRLAQKIFSHLTDNRVLLIGAGETSELVVRHFYEQGIKNIVIANRTPDVAIRLANQFNGRAISLSKLPQIIPFVDIIISSTNSSSTLINKEMIHNALKIRKHSPIFMIDLAVPRDFEPEIAQLKNVFLYNTDDLHSVINYNLKTRQQAARQAEVVIEHASQQLIQQLHIQNKLGNTLYNYRKNIDDIREKEVKKTIQYLKRGGSPEQAIYKIANAITSKIMHIPSIQLKKIARSDDNTEQILWARELLGVNDTTQQPDDQPSEIPLEPS